MSMLHEFAEILDKTFVLFAVRGLIPRCISYVYAWLKQNKSKIKRVVTKLSVYEIYVGQIRDLLNNGRLMQRFDHPKVTPIVTCRKFSEFVCNKLNGRFKYSGVASEI